MADIPFGGLVYRYLSLDIDRPRFPHIEACYSRLCERSAYQEHIMLPFGTEPGELVSPRTGICLENMDWWSTCRLVHYARVRLLLIAHRRKRALRA